MNKANILYIDDELSNLRVFKNTFKREYNVLLASSAREGMGLLKNNKIDILITDHRMPEMTGVEMLTLLAEIYPSPPPTRVLLSGYVSYEDIRNAISQCKIYEFVSKPWKTNEMRTLFSKILGTSTLEL